LIFAVVPPFGRLLNGASTVADHALDQVVREAKAGRRPRAIAGRIAPGQPNDQRGPYHERRGRDRTARACAQNDCGEEQLDEADQREESAAQRERLDSFRFHHATEEMSRAFVTHLVGLHLQRAKQQPLLQDRAAGNRDGALEPRGGDAQRHDGHEEQRPRDEPAAIDAALHRAQTDQPPGENPAHVLRRVSGGQRREAAPQAGLRK
jgi:hypothetical protein